MLSQNMKDLKEGSLDVKVAGEMHNASGKIINTIKIQMEYAKLRDEKPNITYVK